MWHDCPVCHEESIRTGCYQDGDGDGLYTRSWLASEITEKSCACELSAGQIDAILAADTCEPNDDW